MTERELAPAEHFVGPSGNARDKYGSRNPVIRYLLGRFLGEIDACVRLASPESILDVGCGEGYVTERLARVAGARTVGIDLGNAELREHWERRETEFVTFRAASAYDLPFEDRSFDCVCALEVLEHLESPPDALAEMARVSRTTLLVSVPREPLWRLLHVAAGKDVRRLGDTAGHLNHWSSQEFERLVSQYADVVRLRRPTPWTVILARTRKVVGA